MTDKPPHRHTVPIPVEQRPRPGRDLAASVAARLGALVLLGFVLVYLQPILVPLFLALLLAVVVSPLVDFLERRRLGTAPAILLAELAATLPVLGIILVFIATIGPLSEALPKYEAQLSRQVTQNLDRVLARVAPEEQRAEIRRQVSQRMVPEALSSGVDLVQRGVRAVTTIFGYFFLTLLLAGFVLHEGRRFTDKFAAAFGPDHPLIGAMGSIGRDVRAYVVAKTIMSGLTAISVWAFLQVCQVDFALFWGLIAFPLNFIPTVGAIVASLPPILVAMVDPEMSGWGATGVALGLLSINGIIGSVIDPRWVGQTVKLSPLVVLLSMLLWGVIWGPVGMILAVPIMVSVKLVCARVPALEPIATLMKA